MNEDVSGWIKKVQQDGEQNTQDIRSLERELLPLKAYMKVIAAFSSIAAAAAVAVAVKLLLG